MQHHEVRTLENGFGSFDGFLRIIREANNQTEFELRFSMYPLDIEGTDFLKSEFLEGPGLPDINAPLALTKEAMDMGICFLGKDKNTAG